MAKYLDKDGLELFAVGLTEIFALKGESSGGGLNDAAKEALLACLEHVAWTDEHGQDYVDALEDALYSEFYTVKNKLTNVSTTNSSTYAKADSSYVATLTADSDYLTYVKVTMGGVDITSQVYTPTA